MTFDELNLAPAILKAVHETGYETPTPIQAQAIPAVLAGHDLLAGAQTGTGKTAAFTLPMLHRLSQSAAPKNKFGGKGIRALVLTPTRELAAQVEESVREYGKYLDINSTVVFGGVGMNPQIDRVKRGVDILVATPGRLLDLQQQGFLDLSTVQVLVLDEADRMLDMGFIHDVKKVLALVPKDKQSLLFSATFSDEIRDLANTLLKNPQSIQVTPSNTTVQRISQVIEFLKRNYDKAIGIAQMIDMANMSPSSFHSHFKEVTAMSPLQYQKRLRLLEARRMMLAEAVDASNAAYRVGYESPSQFSREYSRMFGAPPVRDIESIRARI